MNDLLKKISAYDFPGDGSEDDFKNAVMSSFFELLGYSAKGMPGEDGNYFQAEKSETLGGRRYIPDYLLYVDNHPCVAVEVKKTPKKEAEGVIQGIEYAATFGVELLLYADPNSFKLYSILTIEGIRYPIIDIRRSDLIEKWEVIHRHLSPTNIFYHLISRSTVGRAFDLPPEKLIRDTVKLENEILSFFRGYSEDWRPIQAGLAVTRFLQKNDKIISTAAFIEQLNNQKDGFRIIKIFGPGGSGKTTLARKIAFELRQRGEYPLWRNYDQRAEYRHFKDLGHHFTKRGKQLFLFYDNPVKRENQVSELLDISRTLSAESGFTVIVFEREDEWANAILKIRSKRLPNEKTFRMVEKLNAEGVNKLCNDIDKFQKQGIAILHNQINLKAFRKNLEASKKRNLLVAVYEATFGKGIEDILEDEYLGIPDENARDLYLFLCGMLYYGVAISDDLPKALLTPTGWRKIYRDTQALKDIIFVRRDGILEVRHVVIANILWKKMTSNPEEEIDRFSCYLKNLYYSSVDKTDVNLSKFVHDFLVCIPFHHRFRSSSYLHIDNFWKFFKYFIEMGTKTASVCFGLLGKYHLQDGNLIAAINILKDGVEFSPDPSLYTAYGQALLGDDQKDKALKIFQEGIKKTPGPGLYTAYGQALLGDDQKDKALKIFQEGIKKTPGPGLYTAYGQALLGDDQKDKALKIFQEGIKKTPGPGLYTAYGQALLGDDQKDKALKIFQEGIKKTPGPGLYTAYGHELLKEDWRLAWPIIKEGLRRYTYKFLEGVYASLLEKIGETEPRETRQKIIEFGAKKSFFSSMLIEHRKKKLTYIADDIGSKIKTNPQQAQAIASVLELNDKPVTALEFLSYADDAIYKVQQIRANCYRRLGKWEEAQKHYCMALNKADTDRAKVQLLNNLAALIRQSKDRKQYQEGIDLCVKAMALKVPNFHWPRENLVFFKLSLAKKEERYNLSEELRGKFGIGKKRIRQLLSECADD